MMMKKLVLFTAFVAFLTLGAFWVSRQFCFHCIFKEHYFQTVSYSHLGLNPEQEKTLKRLESDFQSRANKLCVKICTLRLVVLNLLKSPNANQETVYNKIEEAGRLQVLLEKETADHMVEVKKYLTAEQANKYFKDFEKTMDNSMRQIHIKKA